MLHPWTGPSSRIRQRVEFDVADYDLRFVNAFGPSESDTRRVHTRVQTDGVVNAALGLSGGIEWVSERGRSTFISRMAIRFPSTGGSSARSEKRAGRSTIASRSRPGCAPRYITRKALGSEPSGFPPRPHLRG